MTTWTNYLSLYFSTLNVDDNRYFWTTYPPLLVYVPQGGKKARKKRCITNGYLLTSQSRNKCQLLQLIRRIDKWQFLSRQPFLVIVCSVKTAKQEIIPTQVLLLREAARVQIVVVLGSTVSNLDKLNTLLLRSSDLKLTFFVLHSNCQK